MSDHEYSLPQIENLIERYTGIYDEDVDDIDTQIRMLEEKKRKLRVSFEKGYVN